MFLAFLLQPAVNAATSDLLRKQEELERKAQELERRERELQSHSLGPGASKRAKHEPKEPFRLNLGGGAS